MKVITAALASIVGLMLASDITRGSALRHWRNGDAAGGMIRIQTAMRLNPFSLDARLDAIESLWEGYKTVKNPSYLHEASLIAGDIVRDFPGNAQGHAVYSAALIFEATHGGKDYPILDALTAVCMDPISVNTLERAMFLLAVKRQDLGVFEALGVKRARLTKAGLNMRCELCGKYWLEHK